VVIVHLTALVVNKVLTGAEVVNTIDVVPLPADKGDPLADEPRILLLDIETRPNLGYVWSLWQQDVGLHALVEATEVICFAAKWLGKPRVEFYSVHDDGKPEMVQNAHRLLDEADAIMTYNGKSFDLPHLNREFLIAGLTPPSPYKQIDLFLTVKRQFQFPSNKLAYVSKALGLSGKATHEGFDLWVKCMAGDEQAWKTMRRYNKRDVTLLEELYEKLRPWVVNHPSFAAITGNDETCPACGSEDLQRRGFAYTAQTAYQQYQCQECGKWSRGTKREYGVTVREIA